MAFVTDTFTDTDSTPLGSHTGETGASWTEHGSYVLANDPFITGNKLRSNVDGEMALWYASGTPLSAEYDVECEITMVTLGLARKAGVAGRIAAGANTFYFAWYNDFGSSWELLKMVAGASTLLGTYAVAAGLQTYTLKLEIRDATKKLFLDGVERISSSDNAIAAAGKAGVLSNAGGGALFDNFSAAAPAAPPSNLVPCRKYIGWAPARW
jgi:hypothetical protein